MPVRGRTSTVPGGILNEDESSTEPTQRGSTTQPPGPTAPTASLREQLRLLASNPPSGLVLEELESYSKRLKALNDAIEQMERSVAAPAKRPRSETATSPGRDRHAAVLNLQKFLQTKPPKLGSERVNSTFTEWRRAVNHEFRNWEITEEHDHRRTVWALGGLSSIPSVRDKFEEDADSTSLCWADLQEAVRNFISDPVIRAANAALELFKSYPKQG